MNTDILGIAESPKVAETIVKLLSKSNFEQDYKLSKTNPIFSFSFTFQGSPQHFKMISLNNPIFIGSLKSDPNNPQSSISSQYEYTLNQNEISLISAIKDLSDNADTVIAFANDTLEGDSFAERLSIICQKDVLRPLYRSITLADLEKAVETADTFYSHYSFAYLMKYEAEHRFSDIMTNFLRSYLKTNLKKNYNDNLRLRPIDLTVLANIYNSADEHESFVQEVSSTIDLRFTSNDNQILQPKWARGDLFCPLTAYSLYSTVINGETSVRIQNIEVNQIVKPRPLPLNCSKLIYLANKYLKMPISDVLKYSLELYEEGFISFPYSKSTRYSFDFDFLGHISVLTQVNSLASFANSISNSINCPQISDNECSDGLPIHPTGAFNVIDDSPKSKLYLLVSRHFLATLSEDGYISECVVSIEVAEEKFELKYKKFDISVENNQNCWISIFDYKNIPNEQMPNLSIGEILTAKSIKLVNTKIQRPEYMTENNLIKLMGKKNIGGKETYGSLNTLLSYGLVRKTSKCIKATPFAAALIVTFEEIGFDFRDTFFIDVIENAIERIKGGESFDLKIDLLKMLLAMSQEMVSKEQTYKALLDLILSRC